MNTFFCALRIDGRPITRTELFGPISRLSRQLEWQTLTHGPFSSMALGAKHALRPLMSSGRGYLSVGDVRLDNRAEVASWAGELPAAASDLDMVAAALDRRGAEIIPRLLGDFAFVFWDARAQKLLAARDAFGVKPLF